MQRTVFCLVLPGDAQSTRRLSEIFLAGCIPVFLGPPYNTMPFADDIDYKSVGVFFNVTNYRDWLPKVSPLTPAVHNNPAHELAFQTSALGFPFTKRREGGSTLQNLPPA